MTDGVAEPAAAAGPRRRPVPLTLLSRPPVTACNPDPLAGFVPQ